MNALVNIETLTAAALFAPGGVEAIISKLESDVRAMPKADILTEGGREEIKSLAYKIARSKTGLDDLGKDFVAELKKQTGKIDADRRIIRDRLDALKDEVRKPVTEWEDTEKSRIEEHQDALTAIRELAQLNLDPASSTIAEQLRSLGRLAQRDWQEFAAEANGALAVSEDRLRAAMAVAQKREADAAELKRLQAAEQARLDAEAKAKRDADTAAAQAAAEQRRLDQEQAAAARAVEQERQRVAAAQEAAAAADRKRQANVRHRAKVCREIIDAMVGAGAPATVATLIADEIAGGRIPHVSIIY